MTEILTESFCERCGTRYTFESARPRIRLKGVKTVSRGLKNFVLSDETYMDEAMAAARADPERESTSYQLDAFHKTFNFCMSCRQYTCSNCWNEAEGRCLSCAPNLGQEILPSPFPDLPANGNGVGLGDDGLVATNGHTTAGGAGEAFSDADLAWPTSDLMRDADVAADPETETLDDLEPIDAAARLAFLGAIPADETTAGAAGSATDALANDRADEAEAAEAAAAAGEETSP